MTRIGVFALACGLLAAGARADEWQKNYEIGSDAEVTVRTGDGNVELRPGPAGEIRARVVTMGYRLDDGGVRIIERQSGGRVSIELKFPNRFVFNLGRRWVRLELEVPPGIRADVRTGDGNVAARGVGGDLRLVTGDGRIEADNCAGALYGRTGDGSVRAAGRFERLELRTGDGSIELAVDEGSRITEPWKVGTGDGSVRASLPETLDFEFDLRTGDGNMDVDLPGITIITKSDHRLRGRAGTGGGLLSVETGDGSIRLARR